MKTYWRSGGIAPRPGRFIPRVRPPVPIAQEAEWAPEPGLEAVTKTKIPITAPAGNWTPVVQPGQPHLCDVMCKHEGTLWGPRSGSGDVYLYPRENLKSRIPIGKKAEKTREVRSRQDHVISFLIQIQSRANL